MAIHVNDSGTWRFIAQPYVYDNNIWRTVFRQYVNDSGVWKKVFPDSGELYQGGGSVETSSPGVKFEFKYSTTQFSVSGSSIYDYTLVYEEHPQLSYPGYYWKQISIVSGDELYVNTGGYGLGDDGLVYDITTRRYAGYNGTAALETEFNVNGVEFDQIGITFDPRYDIPFSPERANLIGIRTDGVIGGNTPIPTVNSNWKYISTNGAAVAAIKTDGTLWLWGDNTYGKLGVNTHDYHELPTSFPLSSVATITVPIQIPIGGTNWDKVEFSKSPGAFYYNDREYQKEKINDNAFRNPSLLSGTQTDSKHVILASKTDGTLWSWGHPDSLGRYFVISPTQTHNATSDWAQSTFGSNFKHRYTVSTTSHGIFTYPFNSYSVQTLGLDSSAAIKTDGTLWVWGYNNNNMLGLGANRNNEVRPTPVTTAVGGSDWDQIQFGNNYALAIKTDGSLWGWGSNAHGQLGIGERGVYGTKVSPVLVDQGPWSEIATGNYVSAGIKNNRLYVWGNAQYESTSYADQFGLGYETNHIFNTMDRSSAWTPVTTFAGGTDWKDDFDSDNPERYLSIGNHGMCAIKDDNKMWAWGKETNNSQLPIQIGRQQYPTSSFANNANWSSVHLGTDHGVGVKTDGTLWVWGRNWDYRFSNASQNTYYTVPTNLHTGTLWKEAKTFNTVTYVLDTSGNLYIIQYWGLIDRTGLITPETLRSSNVKAFDVVDDGGDYATNDPFHTLVYIKTDGTLWTLGYESATRGLNVDYGTTQYVPYNTQTLAGGNNWVTVSCGEDHVGAIKSDGTLWMWGYNQNGQLGTNDTVNRLTPVRIGTATNWKQVSCSSKYTAAIKTDGTLWVWGYAGPITDSIQPKNINDPQDKGFDRWFIGLGRFPTSYNKTEIWTDNLYTCQYSDGTSPSYQYGNYIILTPVQVAGSNWSTVATSNGRPNTYSISNSHVGGTRCALAATKTDGTLWVWGNRSVLGIGAWYDYSGVVSNVTWRPMEWYFDSNQTSFCYQGPSNVANNYKLPTKWEFGPTVKHVSLAKGTLNGTDTISVIKTDGTLWMWGNSGAYNLETGNYGNEFGTRLFANGYDFQRYGMSTPITMYSGGTNWKKVSMSDDGVVATKTDGTLWVWDKSTMSATMDTQTPSQIGSSTDWDVAARHRRGWSALKTDGTLWVSAGAYPRNNIVLGNAGNEDINFITQLPGGGTDWSLPSEGGNHTFIATRGSSSSNRNLYTWANLDPYNINYTTGFVDPPGPRTQIQPLPVSLGITDFSQFFGSLPIVSSGGNWLDFSHSSYHGGAIDYSGNMWMWGSNENDELGLPSGPDEEKRVTPVLGPTGPWKKISCGLSSLDGYYMGNYTLGVKSDGSPWSWGLFNSRIGVVDPFLYETNSNIDYPNLRALRYPSHFSFQGQLGQTTSSYIRTTPIPVTGGTDWKSSNTSPTENTITAGGILIEDFPLYISSFKTTSESLYKNQTYGHGPSAAIKADGTLWTWGGMGDYYNWGLVSSTDVVYNIPPRRTPPTPTTQYSGGTNWKSLSGRGQAFAAIKTDGTLWCWGQNYNFQVGNNSTTTVYTPVTTFAGGTNWKQVSVGNAVTAAVKTDGTLWAWGNGHHAGIGSNQWPKTPCAVSAGGSLYDWDSVCVGYFMSAGIKTTGYFYWWGLRESTINTDPATEWKLAVTPVTVMFAGAGLTWSQLSVGNDHISIIRSDGTLWMWGKIKLLGGRDKYVMKEVPTTEFTPGNDWKQVSCTANGNAAVKTDGTLWVWGVLNCGLSGNNTWPNAQDGNPRTVLITSNTDEWWRCPQEYYYISQTPVPIPGNNWSQVSLVERSIMATKTDGTLWIWGGRTQYDYNMIESVTGPQRVELDITDSSVKDVESSEKISFWLK